MFTDVSYMYSVVILSAGYWYTYCTFLMSYLGCWQNLHLTGSDHSQQPHLNIFSFFIGYVTVVEPIMSDPGFVFVY